MTVVASEWAGKCSWLSPGMSWWPLTTRFLTKVEEGEITFQQPSLHSIHLPASNHLQQLEKQICPGWYLKRQSITIGEIITISGESGH